MKIVICGSLNFTPEIKKLSDELEGLGFEVQIPLTSERILRGEVTLEDIKKEKENGEIAERVVKFDAIRKYWEVIKTGDAILVANYEKKGVPDYIGGNTFLEMGFAHVLEKKIFLLNPIPEVGYKDELVAMQPVVLDGDLSKIQ